jgi:hypothetical protein
MFTSSEPVALDTHRFISPCALRAVDSEREYMRYVDGVFRSLQSNKGTSLRKGLAIIFEHIQSRLGAGAFVYKLLGYYRAPSLATLDLIFRNIDRS